MGVALKLSVSDEVSLARASLKCIVSAVSNSSRSIRQRYSEVNRRVNSIVMHIHHEFVTIRSSYKQANAVKLFMEHP